MPENDETKHHPNYCELEPLLEKMAKENEIKRFTQASANITIRFLMKSNKSNLSNQNKKTH
nr:hypothetical protein HPHPH23_0149 [Helicobacter pylori Hp H-23]